MAGNSDRVVAVNAVAPGDGFFFEKSQTGSELLRIWREQLQPICDGIGFGAPRQFINQSFHHECSVRVPYRPPPQHRNIHRGMVRRNLEVCDGVVRIRGAFDGGGIHAVLHHHWREGCSRDD